MTPGSTYAALTVVSVVLGLTQSLTVFAVVALAGGIAAVVLLGVARRPPSNRQDPRMRGRLRRRAGSSRTLASR